MSQRPVWMHTTLSVRSPVLSSLQCYELAFQLARDGAGGALRDQTRNEKIGTRFTSLGRDALL